MDVGRGHEMDVTSEKAESPFSCSIDEGVATIQISGDVFSIGTSLGTKQEFLSKLSSLNRSRDIKVVLLLNDPGTLSDKNYSRFIETMLDGRAGRGGRGQRRNWRDTTMKLARQGNALNQFIMTVLRMETFVVLGLQGDIASPFFGASLAADMRCASDDVTFTPSHLRLSIAPTGGLGFFLPRFVGRAKAQEILLSPQPLSTDKAKRLGLVNHVFTREDFIDRCHETAHELASYPTAVAVGVKGVINSIAADLDEFFEYENRVMERSIVTG